MAKVDKLLKELLNTKKAFDDYGIDRDFRIDFKIHKKTVSEEDGFTYVKGYACTSDKDWVDDIITNEAMEKSSKDLLRPGCKTVFFNHDEDLILGTVVDSYFDGKGIFVSIKLSNADDVKSFKTKVQEGILSSFSIRGYFKTIEMEKDKDGYVVSWKILEMDLMEVSLVGLPCNKFASVVEVIEKSFKKFMSGLTKKVGKKTKNSGKAKNRKVKTHSERSKVMSDEKKNAEKKKQQLIRDIVEEHAVDIVETAVEEAFAKRLDPLKEQVDKCIDLVSKSVEKKTSADEDADEDEDEDDDEDDDKKQKTEKKQKKQDDEGEDKTPEWAKSMSEALKGLNEKFADLEKETSKRKGYQRKEDDDDESDNDIPKKVLKGLDDDDTIQYVKYLIENGGEYDKLETADKQKAKTFMFALINEASKSKG